MMRAAQNSVHQAVSQSSSFDTLGLGRLESRTHTNKKQALGKTEKIEEPSYKEIQ